MEKILQCFYYLLLLTVLFTKCNTTSENYYTGLKVYKDFDKNRKFDTTSNDKAPFYFRPLKIDLFYPSAEKPDKEPLLYGDILNMYEQRMNYNNSLDSCKKGS